MTKSQHSASRRVSDINDSLRRLRPRYEALARCSAEHTRVFTQMSNLQHEREMLVTIHQLQG